MTLEQLEELEKLEAATVTKEWRFALWDHTPMIWGAVPDSGDGSYWPVCTVGFAAHDKHNADFIVAMRQHLMPLISAARELHMLRKALLTAKTHDPLCTPENPTSKYVLIPQDAWDQIKGLAEGSTL